jgi:hypothetical protein
MRVQYGDTITVSPSGRGTEGLNISQQGLFDVRIRCSYRSAGVEVVANASSLVMQVFLRTVTEHGIGAMGRSAYYFDSDICLSSLLEDAWLRESCLLASDVKDLQTMQQRVHGIQTGRWVYARFRDRGRAWQLPMPPNDVL